MKTYYVAFGHWCGNDAPLKFCNTMEEAKAAIYEDVAKKKKAKNEHELTYDAYYITTWTV